jgi:hypothetical protein
MRLSFFIFSILFPYQIFSQTENKPSHYINDTLNSRKVYLVVDKAPETSIETRELWSYILNNDFWPAMDTTCWFHTVFLSFIVEANGSVSNIKIEIRGSGFCDDPVRHQNNKALMKESLIKSLSKLHWTPGELKGQKVPVLISMPIHVHLNFD